MAIQIPNPGTGNGATGDNEFVLWSKVKDNFTDQTNAASRLVGKNNGNLVEMTSDGIAGTGWGASNPPQVASSQKLHLMNNNGIFKVITSDITSTGAPPTAGDSMVILNLPYASGYNVQMALTRGVSSSKAFFRGNPASAETTWREFWHTGNATRDANGFLKAASPIVKVFADKVELNGEAEDQDVTYKKNGVGDYTITTVSGLSTDGWYIELPKDMNGNPKVAVTLQETNGVISLKTYKRIFSMETFTFEPDLDNPLDIPDTRWIDLRLNEIPVEIEDDTQTEV